MTAPVGDAQRYGRRMMITPDPAPAFNAQIAATQNRLEFTKQLRDARAQFADAATQLALVPRAEPFDVNGPLGLATNHVSQGLLLLHRAVGLGAKGVPEGLDVARSALRSASVSVRFLGRLDMMLGSGTGDEAYAASLLAASTQLVASARRELDAVIGS